jgi:hypothetical protein
MPTTSVAPSRAAEVQEKLESVRDYLDRSRHSGALFTSQLLLGWITGGLEDVIVRGAAPAFVWALVTADGAYLITSNIEAVRLEAEEDPAGFGFEVLAKPWYEGHFQSLIADLCDPKGLVGDGTPAIVAARDLQRLRLRLSVGERERMRVLGQKTCDALEGAMRETCAGQTEFELCAEVSRRMELARIQPAAVLVGADERRRRFRHPTVSDTPIKRDVLVVVVGVQGGLNVACSRTVAIGTADSVLADRHRIACQAEAHALAATRPGRTYGDAVQAQIDVYEAHGYRDEWRAHTQGGPIGYGGREFVPPPISHADEFTMAPVESGHAVAWNPTVQGGKSEDTFLVGETENEPITNSRLWPSVEVTTGDGSMTRPAILELG